MKNNKINLVLGGGVVIIIAILGVLYFLSTPSDSKVADVAANMAPKKPRMNINLKAPNLTKENFGKAAFNWELKTMDGKSAVLSDYKGKIIFLNLWATWCGPCLAEFPTVQNLYESMKDDVVFLAVSQEDFSTVHSFYKTEGYTFPIYVAEGEFPPAFATDAIPATYIIDRDGNIVVRHIGSTKWDDDSVKAFLKSL